MFPPVLVFFTNNPPAGATTSMWRYLLFDQVGKIKKALLQKILKQMHIHNMVAV